MQGNMMTDCTWCTHQTFDPDQTEYIIAYICDKCAKQKTTDLCHDHFTQWKNQNTTMRCPACGGTLSWEARNLTNGQKEWYINPGPGN